MDEKQSEILKILTGFGSRKMEEIGFIPFIVILGISLICSLFISFLYTHFHGRQATGSNIHRSFPLLGISITAIFICIQFSLPLSLGLLGALSIVRFRTPIKEPEEIGFIMLVVATSLCCATFNILFLGAILTVAVIGLLILQIKSGFLGEDTNDGMFIVTMPTEDYKSHNQRLLTLLQEKLPDGRLDSISENKEEAVISYSFSRFKKEIISDLQSGVAAISVDAGTNLYFNRSGDY